MFTERERFDDSYLPKGDYVYLSAPESFGNDASMPQEVLEMLLLYHLLRDGAGSSQAEDDSEDYRLFTTRDERYELYIVGRRLAEYVVEEDVEAVYFMDRSARPAYVAMKTFWQSQHPDVAMPHIGFLNPKGFVSREDVFDGVINTEKLKAQDEVKQGEIEPVDNIRVENEIINELQTEVQGIDPAKPVLVFDVCLHSGDSMRPVVAMLQKAGLEDVRVGVAGLERNRSEIEPSLTVMKQEPFRGCYPFDMDELTSKVYTSIHSRPNRTYDSSFFGQILRDEVRRSVEEFIHITP